MSERGPHAPDGRGLTIVVNPSAGPALSGSPVDALREGLPAAHVIELSEPGQLVSELRRAASSGAVALGVAGGDGSVNAAAEVAMELDLPLLVVPAGTLNHLARDLGVGTVDDSIQAYKADSTTDIDVAFIDSQPFLNTASFGSYVELVDRRERFEGRIGKWPAFVLAFFSLLFRSAPVAVRIDGVERRVWVAFFGNCRYTPPGIAPRSRSSLDDGLLDVRILDARHGWARLRLMAAGIIGRAERARGFEQKTASRIQVGSANGPLRLARDGETFDGGRTFEVSKVSKALRVYAPAT